MNKRRIGNAKNLINAAAFNRINTVGATCSLRISCESLAVRCEERQLYLKGMQLEKTVEIQASLWYLSADLTLFFFNFLFGVYGVLLLSFLSILKRVLVALDYTGTWLLTINPLCHSTHPLGPWPSLLKILELTIYSY